MTRYLKALGLVLLAAIAIGAVSAASASAEFESNDDKIIITGQGETVFSTKVSPELKATCFGNYSGTETEVPVGGFNTLTVHPTFTECAGFATKITTTGCNLILYGETTKHPRTDLKEEETDAPVEIECEVGKTIIIKGMGCTVSVPGPGGERVHGAIYHNEGAGNAADNKATFTLDKIKYTTEGALCALAGLPKKGEDGTLTTTPGQGITLKAYKDLCKEEGGKDVECPFVPVGGVDKDAYTEGEQVPLVWSAN